MIEHDVLEVCTLIRDDEDNSATPIMVISSNASLQHEMELLKQDIEFFIKKPINIDVLYYTIKNIVHLLKSTISQFYILIWIILRLIMILMVFLVEMKL